MIDKKHFDSLKLLETELQVEIWKRETGSRGSQRVMIELIDEMKEALGHISKAIDILEWDEK